MPAKRETVHTKLQETRSSRAPDLSPTAKLEIRIAFCDLPKNEAALAL